MEHNNQRALGRVPNKSYAVVSEQTIASLLAEIPDEIKRPLTKALKRILDKQAADERLNYEAIERSLYEKFSGHIHGPLADADPITSDYYHVLFDGFLYAYGTLTVVGSTDTVVDIYRSTDDGATFDVYDSVTIEAGEHKGKNRLAGRVKHGDLLYYDIPTIGTNAEGILMQTIIQNYDRTGVGLL